MEALIRKLTGAFGPSGFEDEVRDIIRAEIEDHVDSIEVDAMGNLIALKKGNGKGKKVMIAAHMDEIGLMAAHITKKGMVTPTSIGFVLPQTLRGARVRFANGVRGIVSHYKLTETTKIEAFDKHFIDVGGSSKEDCPVPIGTPGIFEREFMVQGDRLTASSMDDRIGCAVAVLALQQLKKSPHDVYFVFTVQEEVGTRGAETAGNRIDPDIVIALDVTPTGDVPGIDPIEVSLGKGPTIKIKDSGMLSHPGLVRGLRAAAESAEIPYQDEVLLVGSTDARAIQVAGVGSAASCISIPCRYVHTQSETVAIGDVENAVKLVIAALGQKKLLL